jgi:multidrug resistance efflux pump
MTKLSIALIFSGIAALGMAGAWAGTLARPVVRAESGVIRDRLVVRGTVVPRGGIADVRAQVSGVVREVRVQEGDAVRAGDLLARISSAESQFQVERTSAEARARREETRRTRLEMQPETEILEAELRMARTNLKALEQDAERARSLAANAAIARRAGEEAEHAVDIARERVRAGEARLRAGRGARSAEYRVARAKAAAAEAVRVEAEQKQSFTSLVAPIDGVVVRRRIDPGDTVFTPSEESAFEIADPAQTELRLEIDESDGNVVTVGARVTIADPRGRTARGHVARANPRLEMRMRHPDAGQLRADGLVRSATVGWDEPPLWLVLGQRVDVSVDLGQHVVSIRLPRGAVQVRDGDVFVQRRRSWVFLEEAVTIGAADDEFVEVHGLELGATVRLL